MGTLGPIPEVLNDRKLVLVMTDCHLRLARAILKCKTTDSPMALLRMDHWVVLQRIPEYVLTVNETQVIRYLFELISYALF